MKNKAFTLIEVLLTLAITLVLITMVGGIGKYVKIQSQKQLTAGAIQILCRALEQYYEKNNKFPFGNTPDTSTPPQPLPYTLTHFLADSGGSSVKAGTSTVTQLQEDDGAKTKVDYTSSVALFYFLDQDKTIRQIIEAITPTLVTNKDPLGNVLTLIGKSVAGVSPVYDLPRFIDPWGMSLRYEYMSGYTFPVIASAGPDRIFGTADDLSSR